MNMYEARQNKEKFSRRIDRNPVRQRVKIRDTKVLQFSPTYTLIITGAADRAVTKREAQTVVNRIQTARFICGRELQGGGYLVIISTTYRDISQIRNDVANVDHNVTVQAGNHSKNYY